MAHPRLWLFFDLFLCVTWLIPRCEMFSSSVRRDLFLGVIWLILCVKRLLPICNLTYFYVWYGSSPRVTLSRHICMWNMAHSYVWNNSFLCATWLISMCDMAHAHVWLFPDLFLCVESRFTRRNAPYHLLKPAITHTHTLTHTHTRWYTRSHWVRQIDLCCRSFLIYIGLFWLV